MKDEGRISVVVYGTLKEGFGNHKTLGANAKLLSQPDETVSGFTMYGEGDWYPVAVPDTDGKMHVEVYSIPEERLANVDALEGYPTLYKRTTVETSSGLEGLLYFQDSARGSKVVTGGDWK